MSPRPLVSVVTGTYNRHEMLAGLIENIVAQTYRPLEHVIVSDGPDDDLTEMLYQYERKNFFSTPPDQWVTITFQELGRQWSHFLGPDSTSAAPFKVAQFLARGDYQVWASDDERFEPDHIESLVDLIEQQGVDFAYSRSRCWWPHDPDGGMVIGSDPPMHGTITQATYRVELLKHRMFELHVGSATDWDQISHWMEAGARWAFLDRQTHTHRVDK